MTTGNSSIAQPEGWFAFWQSSLSRNGGLNKTAFRTPSFFLDRPAPKATTQELKKEELAVEMSHYYEDATALARRLTLWSKEKKVNLAICSGGGPGIMEAANKGARQARGASIGLNINLPFEQEPNPYISKHLNFEFHYFFLRKFWFLYHAKALVVFPGGFGTLDEMMEVLTLIQTQKIKKDMLVVVYGKKFWDKIINFNHLVETGMIDESDLKLFRFCDTVDEALDYLTRDLQRFLYKRQKAAGKFQPWVLDI